MRIFGHKIVAAFLGLILALAVLEAGLRLGDFVMASIREHENARAFKEKNVYRILCLGESTTEGQYPKYLEKELNRRRTGIRFIVIDKGRTGSNTSMILKMIATYLDEYRPHMVVTMMGINDRGIRYYQDIPDADTWLFAHCRVYRFGRILYMHLAKNAWKGKLWRQEGTGSEKTGAGDAWLSGEGTAFASEVSEDKMNVAAEPDAPNMEQAWNYLQADRLDEAEVILKKCLELNKDVRSKSSAYFGLGRICYKRRQFAEAENFFMNALRVDPKNDGAYFQLGCLYKDQEKIARSENAFKQSLKLNPMNYSSYVALAWLYHDEGKFSLAEDNCKKAIGVNPHAAGIWESLGRFYQTQGKFPQAEDAFKKALALNAKNAMVCFRLGQLYRLQDKLEQAEAWLKRALELDPKNPSTYFDLGRIYVIQHRFSEFESVMKSVLRMDPDNGQAYFELGQLYRDRQDFPHAEDSFKKALELESANAVYACKLGEIYLAQGKNAEAVQTFEKALAIDPKNEQALRALKMLFEQKGRPELIKKYARRVGLTNSVVTVTGHRELKKILDERGIRLVCAQYPMRSVEPLKEIFGNETNVIFVDNKGIFEEAVKKEGYQTYFKDMFAGDFGHCTQKGNELLAKNIADSILKEVFNR